MLKNKFLLSLLSAILLIAAWPPLPTAFLLFVAFVPLLFVYEQLKESKRRHLKFLGFTYLTLFLFNTGTTWWVWNASPSGSIIMLFANSLIMSLPFWTFSITAKHLKKLAYPAFVFFYTAFEYFHFNWTASWPWLTLGKGLASMPRFIQWYEYTGELGGTVLILVVNILVFKALLNNKLLRLWQPASVILGMHVLSLLVSFNYSLYYKMMEPKMQGKTNCIIVQPNIDPYQEKFSDGANYMPPDVQLQKGIDEALPLIDDHTDLIVFPETAVTGWNEEKRINEMYIMQPLLRLTDSGRIAILTGAETVGIYRNNANERPSITARFDESAQMWWDSYNTSMLIKNGKVDSLYHKSKLVPGVEKMPFPFLESLSIDLGGASGSLGESDRPINFIVNDKVKIAPLVCYESVFGDYTCDFVKDGANALAVITNDGWWGETPGYRQHLMYGAIRCIETRREMLRSANTGVSAKINMLGEVTQSLGYKKRGAFKCTLITNNVETFYVRFGNVIGVVASVLTVLLIVAAVVLRFSVAKKG